MPNSLPVMKNLNILVLDDNVDFLNEVRLLLLSSDIKNVVTISDSGKLFTELEKNATSVLLLDWVMPGLTGADLLPMVVQRYPQIPIIVMTAVSDVATVVSCMKQGTFDYITKPVDIDRLLATVDKASQISELSSQNRLLKGYLLGEPLADPDCFKDILACSDKMQAIFKIIETIAPSRHPVLITGETGVGKEMIARAVHKASGLKGDFVPLNAAGLDDQLFSDTLFGHKKGAYTGATESRDGLITKAQGGTLFLDEIGDLNHVSQMKLLRLLQEHEYYRLGSDVLVKTDARIIAASNQDFEKFIADGKFRLDLYQRLSFHDIHVPALRERKEDIPLLAEHYATKSAESFNRKPPGLSRELCRALQGMDFPGNVRELIKKMSNAVLRNRSGILTIEDFPDLQSNTKPNSKAVRVAYDGLFSINAVYEEFPSLDDLERLLIDEALKLSGGNKSAAAGLLGISRPTLNKKLAVE